MKRLKKIQEGDLEEVGRKAFELARLKRSGFPVPDGFVITQADCKAFFSKGENCAKPIDNNGLCLERATDEIILNRVISGFQDLGSRVAVRSSAVKEDLHGISFAGQYESVLNITGVRGLLEAVRVCYNSRLSSRVRGYARQNGISPEDLKLAVLVQKQVQCEAAGVMFTINPVTGNDREMVVEAVSGLGEALVSGQAQPDRYRVDGFSEKIIDKSLSTDPLGIFASPQGGTAQKRKDRTGPILDDETLLALVRLGLRIQTLYGFPLDIEWGLANGQLHILQARPVTSIYNQGIEGQWTTADFRDGGVACDVVTPFMWSLYEHVWEPAMQSYLEEIRLIPRKQKVRWSQVFFARPYWNLGATKEALARLPGYKERNLDQDLGIDIPYKGDGFVTPFGWRGLLRGIRVMLALERSYAKQNRKTQKAVERFEVFEKELLSKDLSDMNDEDLWGLFINLVEHRHFDLETAYFKTVFNTANSRLDFKAALDRANRKGAELAYLTLISGLKPLRTFSPLRQLWRMSRNIRGDRESMEVLERAQTGEILTHPVLGRALGAFLKSYGYHSTRELDLRVPRWDEDPGFIIETLRGYVRLDDDDDPEVPALANRKRYGKACQKLQRFFSGRRILQRKPFMRKLRRARFYTWYKEEVRDRSTRMYALIRKISLEVGRRLAQRGILREAQDFFYLRYQDVINSLGCLQHDVASIRQRIEVNRNYMMSFRHFENPNEVGRRWQYAQKPAEPEPQGGVVYRGIPCAPGRVSGRVRIIRDINESHRLQRGDILVTRFTDPGWTPLFSLISGVITETGGILSHAAIIAREQGVPAVLSVQGATSRMRDDVRVVLDGNRGEVIPVC